ERGTALLCIENYYGPESCGADKPERGLDGCLLLGLPEDGQFGMRPNGRFVAPPLLDGVTGETRNGVVVLGYDTQVARFGIELATRLGGAVSTTVVASESEVTRLRAPGVRVVPMPDEPSLKALLGEARVVVCKDGFQQ